jgi:citrate synthase
MTEQPQECIHSRIWEEEAETDNPFSAKVCYCAGYDVYGDILKKASWIEYLYLLFKQERPNQWQAQLLERLMIALANPGPRDHSVRAAMSASVGGSTAASTLISALAVGAGQVGGAREIYAAMNAWISNGRDLNAWNTYLQKSSYSEQPEIWPEREYPAGFELYADRCATPILQTLEYLSSVYPAGTLKWLQENREVLEKFSCQPLAMTGVAAATFIDLAFEPLEAEMMYLLLRLPGAAAHALEQHMQWKRYPFFKNGLVLTNDPGAIENISS